MFEIILGTVLAIQCVKELVFAFQQTGPHSKVEAFALAVHNHLFFAPLLSQRGTSPHFPAERTSICAFCTSQRGESLLSTLLMYNIIFA